MSQQKIDYRHVDRAQLAEYLGAHEVIGAEARGETRIYRCHDPQLGETLAIALADGSGLIIAPPPRRPVDRRRRAR